MAWDGSGAQFFKNAAMGGGLFNAAWSMHCFVRSSVAPSGGSLRFAMSIHGNDGGRTPDTALAWDHTAGGFSHSAYNRAGSSSGAYSAAVTTTSLLANTWYSFGGSYDGTNVRVYVNGVLEATTAGGVATNISACDLGILGVSDLGAGNTCPLSNGQAAEAAWWTAALSADNFAALAKGFRPHRVRPQGLYGYAPLVRGIQDLKIGPLTSSGSGAVQDHPRVIG